MNEETKKRRREEILLPFKRRKSYKYDMQVLCLIDLIEENLTVNDEQFDDDYSKVLNGEIENMIEPEKFLEDLLEKIKNK